MKRHPCWIVVGLLSMSTSLSAQGSCVQPEAQQTVASDGASGDTYGSAVAVSGPWTLLGSPASGGQGAAYAMNLVAGNWVEAQKLTASDGVALDAFGHSVEIDGTLAIVGAPSSAYKPTKAGAAYVYRHDGTHWVEEQKLTPSNGQIGDQFGWAVSVEGNVAVVGSPMASGAYYQQGMVYVFRFDGTQWNEEAILVPILPYLYDNLGSAVAQSGNVLFLGAPGRNLGPGPAIGSVFTYRFDGTAWQEEVELMHPFGQPGDQFGTSVDLDGNLGIVGIYGGSGYYFDCGSAMIYRHDGTSWVQEQEIYVQGSRAKTWSGFGESVAIQGDQALVGAPDADKAKYLPSGQAYLFRFDGTAWHEQLTLSPSDGAINDKFGVAVDLDGQRTVVGAKYAQSYGSRSGRVYFDQVTDLTLTATPVSPGPGSTLTLANCGGKPTLLGLLALSAWNGSPMFLTLTLGGFDAAGERVLAGPLPPGLSGNSASFAALGFVATGEIRLSNIATVAFQ